MGKQYLTPEHMSRLHTPTTNGKQKRRVWSIDLETVWLPYLTASNVMGVTAIPLDALGCPIRLAYDKDGSVKFSQNGRPVTRVAKSISDEVTLIRDNFIAELMRHAELVATERQEDYASQVEMSVKAGKPIIAHDKAELDKAIQLQIEEAMRQAKEEATQEATQEATTPEQEKELVAVS